MQKGSRAAGRTGKVGALEGFPGRRQRPSGSEGRAILWVKVTVTGHD